MPRFVILHHELTPGGERASHWDFMFEEGDALRTWALEEAPQAGKSIPALALADHRLAYLSYEGPVSGDRGTVTQWDTGTCEMLEQTETKLRLQLHGGKCEGVATLEKAASAGGDQRWVFSFLKS